MADSARLSATPPIRDQNSSSQRTSSTLTISSDDELSRLSSTSCGVWPDARQTACQCTSDHESPTSSNARLPTLSPESSRDEDAQDSTEDSIMGARTNFTDASGGRSYDTSTRGCSCVTRQPSQSRDPHSAELLRAFRDPSDCLSGAAFEPKANVLNIWKWEILNCVLALGMIGSMYIILLHYDGQPTPDWGSAINLSTLVAIIATLLRTMLVFVVSEIIGQAKWEYLASGRRSEQIAPVRRLIQTSRFNDASQGLLGAVKLLPTIVRDPATLTAVIVMVASLGTGSFVQQAIQTQSCQFPVDGAHASLPIARNITGNRRRQGNVHDFDETRSVAAVRLALAPESEEVGSPVSVECSTGNCTYNSQIGGIYSTVAVCSMCADTSPLIRREAVVIYDENSGFSFGAPAWDNSWRNYTLPNGMSAQATFWNDTLSQSTGLSVSSGSGPTEALDWAGDLVSLEMKGLSQWALANITIIAPDWISPSSGYTDYVAATCTLYLCLRSHKASVTAGKLEEVLVSTIPLVPVLASWEITEEIENAMQSDHMETIMSCEGIFYWACLDSYHGAVQSPCLVNDTIWTRDNKSSTVDMQRLLLLHASPDASGRRVTIENTVVPAECIYGIRSGAKSSLEYVFWQLFNGTCTANSFANDSEIAPMVECDGAYWLARFYSDEGTATANIFERIDAFTERLSNKIRMGLLNDPETVSGQVLQMTVCSRMQYSWLAFPAVLVAATNGLLAWTIFQSSRRRGRVMVWKTSILPFMFYGQQFVVQNAEDVSAGSSEPLRRDEGSREPLLDLDQMEAEARQRKVRFEAFD